MTGKEIIKDILLFRKWTQSKLAKEMGKTQTNITGYLNRGKNEMRLDVFAEMLNAMNCEIVVRDKTESNREWIIDMKSESNHPKADFVESSSEPKKTKPRIKLTNVTEDPEQHKTNNLHKIDLDTLLADDEEEVTPPKPKKSGKRIKLT